MRSGKAIDWFDTGAASSNEAASPGASLSILYVGANDGTALDRANALKRLGHRVTHVDLRELLPRTPWVYRITWHMGGHLLAPLVLRALPRALGAAQFDVCHVDCGEWVTPHVIALLRRHARRIVNYNIDDPLSMRDYARFKAYRSSLPYYDLCVVVRDENVPEAQRLGARNVMRVYRSSDEVSHAPRPLTSADRERWRAEVLFLGTWFPERGPFLLDLVRRGVPLTIRGANWNKAREWEALRPYWKGGQLHGDDYALALQCARVNLGLLSKGNRDLHTTRSLEIPALGGLLCAERTPEHLALYVEGLEALFWSDAQECARVCLEALADEPRRRRIAAAGQARSRANAHYNENVMRAILARLTADG
ncbi:MAG TPA: glycosyltransferase [Steroidobacteraceae bacterium]|nr:glycosyltransferase [Steroidobacteraceae bacterium]